jgi:amino acid transporter
MVLIICVYGFQSLWQLINKNNRVPKPVIAALQIILLLVMAAWLVQLVPYLSKIAKMSVHSTALPYVSAAVVVLVFIAYTLLYKKRFLLRDLVLSMLVCLIIASNQFALVRVIGSGQGNVEFKMLADWYIQNAKEGEKLLSTMSSIVSLYASRHKDSFVHTDSIKTDDPMGFVKECYEKDITYVAWDSRLGLTPDDLYYKRWRLKNIAALAYGKDVGPYEFITQIRVSQRRFINVFRLKKSPPREFAPESDTDS